MSLSLSRLFGFAGSGLAAAAFAFPLTAAFAEEEREIVIQRVILGEKESGEKEEKEEKEDDDDDKDSKAYWIGIGLQGTEGADGLTIAEVYPDSPALKAELKAGDVLVAIGDKKLERHEQLVDLVRDSHGRTLKIKLLREGKEIVREVHPGKRPGAFALEIREEKEEKEGKGEKKEGIRFVPKPGQPGASPSGSGSSFPPGGPISPPLMARMTMAMSQAQLPDDMEVSISKKGNKPAVVVAKQGDKLWKTTENELGMLPPPAQAYASRLLRKEDAIRGRMPAGVNPGMMPGMGGGMMMPGMPSKGGMSGMPGAPATGMGDSNPAREMQRFELRLGKDGKIERIVEGDKNAPQVRVLPNDRIQVEIREEADAKERTKGEKKETKSDKPAEETPDAVRAERVRRLQLEAEQLRALLNKLREQVQEKE